MKLQRFRDRTQAGQLLAAQLAAYVNRPDVLVLALPRGGVIVAFEVARALHAPLDVIIVRKLGVPGEEELAMGAIASGGVRVLNDDVVQLLGVSQDEINKVAAHEQREVERREHLYRGDRQAYELRGRTVILVDDGIATGATMRAAVAAVKQQQPARIVIAVPVAASSTCEEFAGEVDELVCVLRPEAFFAVGFWYEHFSQTTDDQVRDLLQQATHEQGVMNPAQRSASLTLLLVGDVMLGRLVNAVMQDKSPIYPWGNTLSLFQQADVRLCNLECVLSDWGAPWSATPKAFHFRSDAKNIAVLESARIDAVSLANNHTLDFEYEGLFHTLSNLDAAGIQHAGAGTTIAAASEPAIWEMRGKKLGLIAFTDNEPGWEATAGQPGIFYVPIELNDRRTVKLLELVSKTKAMVDLLVVSAHWGPNWGYVPPAEHVTFAHALIDAGTDVVFGHSGHVFRGIELYREKPILYCTGDFIDDYAVDELARNDQSFIFVVETDGQAIVRLLLYPTVIEACQARRAKHNEREAIVAKMQGLCMKLNTLTIWDGQAERLEVQVHPPSLSE